MALAREQNKLTEEFIREMERYYAQYQLRLISENELYQFLEIEE